MSKVFVRGVVRLLPSVLVLLVAGASFSGCSQQKLSSTGSLRVTVIGADNVPLAGAKVVSGAQPAGQLKVTGITGDDGVVTYSGLKPGDYEFYVSRFDYEQKNFGVAVPTSGTASVTVTLAKSAP